MHITPKRVFRQFQRVPRVCKIQILDSGRKTRPLLHSSPPETSSSRQLLLGPALSSLTSLEQAPLPSDPTHTRTLGALSLCAVIVCVFSLPRQPLGEQGTQLNGASGPQHGAGPGSGINIRRPDDQMTVPGGGWHCHTLCLEDTSQRQAHTSRGFINPRPVPPASLTRLCARPSQSRLSFETCWILDTALSQRVRRHRHHI